MAELPSAMQTCLAPQAWTLLQIELGGYVVGRSPEKVAPIVAALLKGDPTKGQLEGDLRRVR